MSIFQGFGVGRDGNDFTKAAMASRSLSGSMAVFVTTSAIDEPTLACFGVVPVFSISANCGSD